MLDWQTNQRVADHKPTLQAFSREVIHKCTVALNV